MGFKKFFERIDMYGQPIQFTYKKRNTFSTGCGGIVSVIILSFLIVYFVMLMRDIIYRKYPNVLYGKISNGKAPKLNINMDQYLQYYIDPPLIPDDPVNPTNSSSQFSIGFYDLNNNSFIRLDPTYFSLSINQISFDQNISNITPIYFSKCSRFYSIKKINKNIMGNTYCIYDYLELEGDSLNTQYKYVTMTINKCVNNTKRYDTIPRNIKFSPSYSSSLYISNFFYYPMHVFQVKKDKEDFRSSNQGVPYPYIKEIQKGEWDDSINVICKSSDEIENLLNNIKFEIYFIQSTLNLTDADNPITQNLEMREYYYVPNLINNINLYYGRSSFDLKVGILPSFISNSSNISYSLTLDNEINYYEDLDTNGTTMISIKIKSSVNTNRATVKYGNILDVFGLVGGISKILLIFGGFIVIYIADIQFKESLINEFYSVIDPKNDVFINRSFKEFLEYKYDVLDIEISKNNLSMYSEDNPNNALNKYFNKDIILKIYNYQKKYKEDGFSFSNEEIDEKNVSTIKPKQDESISYIDFIKYAIVYEVFKNETYNGMYFNIFEIIIITFCYCCATKKLKKKYTIFQRASERLAQDTDFLSIVRSVQEFECFKNIFFDADQLNLFNSMVNNPVTIKEINDIGLKKFELRMKIKEKEKELRDNTDIEKNTKNKKEVEELKRRIKKMDNLNYENENEEEHNLDTKLKKLNSALTTLAYNEDRNEYDIDKKLLKNLNVRKKNETSDEKTCLENFISELDKMQKRERKNKKEDKTQIMSENPSEKNAGNNIEINAQFFWDKFANYKKK